MDSLDISRYPPDFQISMAELALYGNELEPPFPFDLVVPQLSWLPLELSAGPGVDKVLPLLDTILVFAGARTSTLNYKTDISACRSIMIRLNSVLENIGEALHQRIEKFLGSICTENTPRVRDQLELLKFFLLRGRITNFEVSYRSVYPSHGGNPNSGKQLP